MKLGQLFVGVAAALMVTACATETAEVKNDTLNVISEEKVSEIKTFDDSVSYFMGQDAALAYWRIAKNDSLLSGKENSEQFIKGMEAGLNAAFESEAYAVGLQQGLMAYANIKGLNDNLKTSLSKGAFLKGFMMAMESETAVDAVKFQADMSEVESRLNTLMMNVADSIENKSRK